MTLTQHPLSAAFPAMSEEDFAALRDDIEDHGQREPIIIFEGMVLDGWHRYRACMELGIKPAQFTFGDADPVKFVLSHNLHRRHLTASQRAMAVVSCHEWVPTGRPKVGNIAPFPKVADLAKEASVSPRTIKDAGAAKKAGLADAVSSGAMSVAKAAKKARAKKAPKNAEPGSAFLKTNKPGKPADPPPATKSTPAEFDDVDVDAAMSIDPMEEIKRLQADNRLLEEQLKALQADDTKAELARQVQMRQALEGRLNFEMGKVNQLQRELDSYGKWYAELRKITGKDLRSEITRIVKAARAEA